MVVGSRGWTWVVESRVVCRGLRGLIAGSRGAEYGTINKVALLGKREAQKKGVVGG